MQLLNEGRLHMNMNSTRKRLYIVAFTVLLILSAGASLYGQVEYRNVFYVDSSIGELHMLSTPEGFGDAWTDIREGQEVPAPGSKLTMVNFYHGVYIFYIGTNQHVYVLYQLETSSWFGGDLTFDYGAPPAAVGSMTSFIDPSGPYIHVFYEGTDGHVHEVYCTVCSSQGPSWHYDDPTHLANAPVATPGSALTSFIDGGVMHVFYFGTNAHVNELYWTGGISWHKDDPTQLGGGPGPANTNSLTSFVDAGVMHVFYLYNGNVHELYWNGSWHTDDPTSLAGAPGNVAGSALTSFVNSSGKGDTGGHVMYLSTDEHVISLSFTSGVWHYFDATLASNGVPAANGSALNSYQQDNPQVSGGVFVDFIGQNAHVYELFWPSEGSASEKDLTVASGSGFTATLGSPLTGLDGFVQP
jgi:hypothetical protein